MVGRPGLERRLAALRAEVAALREMLGVLDEQLAHSDAVAADALTRAAVAETPLAAREGRQAQGDAWRVRRQRDEVAARLTALAAESDDLLEQLFSSTEREVNPT